MRHRNLAAIGIAALTIAGCSGPQAPDAPGPGGSATPQNAGDFSYNPPDGLKQQDQQKNGNTMFFGPTEDGFQTNLGVKSGQNKNLNAEQFSKDTVAKEVSQFGVTVKEQEKFPMPGSDAYTWLISRQSSKTGKRVEQRQFVVIKNGIAVLFTLTAAESAMKKWDQALADSINNGFRWGRQDSK